jgi:hypothetical protein
MSYLKTSRAVDAVRGDDRIKAARYPQCDALTAVFDPL